MFFNYNICLYEVDSGPQYKKILSHYTMLLWRPVCSPHGLINLTRLPVQKACLAILCHNRSICPLGDHYCSGLAAVLLWQLCNLQHSDTFINAYHCNNSGQHKYLLIHHKYRQAQTQERKQTWRLQMLERTRSDTKAHSEGNVFLVFRRPSLWLGKGLCLCLIAKQVVNIWQSLSQGSLERWHLQMTWRSQMV